jgi:predicted nucleic acid-binding protein
LNLYLDASALVKRYVGEDGSDLVREAMRQADGWFICRIGFVETMRAVGLSAGTAATRAVRQEWAAFGIVEVDEDLADHASSLALARGLHSLDALHLAAALVLPGPDLTVATWDQRLHAAAVAESLDVLPAVLP